MFDSLTQRLSEAFRRLRAKGRLTPEDVDVALREVRLALLEADVNFRVVKDLIARIREQAVGQEVLSSLTPAQMVVKVVHDELRRLLGDSGARLNVAPSPPTVILLVGLQGAGKTTLAAKLARHLAQGGRRPLLVGADLQRPAAVEQLRVLGEAIGVPVLSEGKTPLEVAEDAVARARTLGRDVVILDTAGRHQVDPQLMEELSTLKRAVRPHEVLLVVDAMTGQEAVTVAEAFHRQVGLDGICLTKLDGDSRGGAALSLRAVTGVPIKFASVGEKPEALEVFHPDRMAARILGMGDVLTLIERAQAQTDLESARALERKLRRAEFDLADFLEQLRQVRRMGPLQDLLALLPGLGPLKQLKGLRVDDKDLVHIEAIIQSMTPEERHRPEIIDGSRRRRIARGSGTSVQDVNRLLRQFEETRRLLKHLAGRKNPASLRLPLHPEGG